MKHIQSHFNPTLPYCGQSGLAPEDHLHPYDDVPVSAEGFCPRCLEVQSMCMVHAEWARQRMEMEAEARRQQIARMAVWPE
jgi:hypothetical protein